jgi:methylmalonyl-CoA mutase
MSIAADRSAWHFPSMSTDASNLPLAAEFPPGTRESWDKLVAALLKDRPVAALTSKTYDGLAIAPLYERAADARPIVGRPAPRHWQVLTRVEHPDPAAANAQALHDLENGATALALVFAGSVGAYGYGLPPSQAAIARVLDGVHFDAISLELDLSPQSKDAPDILTSLLADRGLSPAAGDIRFGFDPLGAMAVSGGSPLAWREIEPLLAGCIADLAGQGFRGPFAVADGRPVHAAGGSEAQELAFALANALAYLRALEAGGIKRDAARQMIFFRLAADADQFLTMAKFRAIRKLWARVEEACGLAPKRAFVSAETAWRMMTRRDPAVNILRTTIAAFSAGLAGADAVSVLPFTAALGLPDGFARRVARNTQLILLEESNLAKVADPGAGSGGLEDLTGQLCATAWTLFQEIERAGGPAAALEAGLIQRKIAAVRSERESAVAHRTDALTGTSDYPNLAEAAVSVLDVAPLAPTAQQRPNACTFESLPQIRLAEPFEQLRDASDRARPRPKIFLANLGKPADFVARATFAKNFFEAAGIEAIGDESFATPADMAAAFANSGATLACLCSSDEGYATNADIAAQALMSAGAKHIYLAGRPKNIPPAVRKAGVKEFIYAGCDALAILRATHDMIGLR